MRTLTGRVSWLSLAVAFALVTSCLAAPPNSPSKGDPRVYRTKVFRLKNFEAQKAIDLLEELLSEPSDILGPAKPGSNVPGGGGAFGQGGGAGAVPSGIGGGFGGPGGGVGPPGGAGPGATLPMGPRTPMNPMPGNFGPGGLGAGPGVRGPGPMGPTGPAGGKRFPGQTGPGEGSTERYRVMLDDRTGSIIMRGPEPDVLVASELMNILEMPADRLLPNNLIAIRAFRVGDAEPDKLAEKLQGLGYKAKIVAVPSLNLVVAAGPDEDLKEITEAIKALDGGGEKGAADGDKPAKPKDRNPTPEDEDPKAKKKP